MRRTIIVLWLYTRFSIKVSLQQQMGAILFTLGKLMRFGIIGIFIYYLLQRTQVLAGYTVHETLVFFLTYHIIEGTGQLLFRETYRFRPLIISGNFDTILTKPIHPFIRILFGGFDILDLVPLSIYVVLMAFLAHHIPHIGTQSIVTYGIMVGNSIVIVMCIHILILAGGILTTDIDHTVMIYRDITRMGTFPIDIYTQPLQTILTFVVPIGVMITFPAKAILNILPLHLFIMGGGISTVFLFMSLFIWRYALATYQSASS